MLHNADDASLPMCAGVATLGERRTYQSAQVDAAAEEEWWRADIDTAEVMAVDESVVALPSTTAARELFDMLVGRWRDCDGSTTTMLSRDFAISNVAEENSVITADVKVSWGDDVRALGVRANCIVEVEMVYYRSPPGQQAAREVAHAMMDRVSELS